MSPLEAGQSVTIPSPPPEARDATGLRFVVRGSVVVFSYSRDWTSDNPAATWVEYARAEL